MTMSAHATVPVRIRITDPALREFGGPPRAATPGAAAVDLVALGVFPTGGDGRPILAGRRALDEPLALLPGQMAYVCVGFAMRIMDPNYAAHVLPRSSSSALGLRLGNTVGLIDSDYAGNVIVAVENRLFGARAALAVAVARGERIAQMYFAPKVGPEWEEVADLGGDTARGAGAYGSTGRF